MKGWVRQSLRFFPSLKKLGFDIKIYLTIFTLFIYFWWWRVLVAACRTFVAARGLLLNCSSWAQKLRHAGLAAYMACGILDSNLCPLHWKVDSQPLDHQGSLPLYINTMVYLHVPYLK